MRSIVSLGLAACAVALVSGAALAQSPAPAAAPPAPAPAGGTPDAIPFDIPYGQSIGLEKAKEVMAAAEAEAENPVVLVVVAAAEAIDVEHVALQPDAENARECRPPSERRRSDTVIVEGDLRAGVAQIERLEQPPDVGLEQFRRAVAGAIRQ